MHLGIIGLGRMGANIALRLADHHHSCVVYDTNSNNIDTLSNQHGITPAYSLKELIEELPTPRIIWIMIPAGPPTTTVITQLAELLTAGDIIIDGGNTYYRDDLTHAQLLAEHNISLLDCGTSGGVWGKERGYCLMIGGDQQAYKIVEPILASLAPGIDTVPRTTATTEPTPQEHGYLYCGPTGAGHFVKMIHNGIEYGMMASIAEGLNILHKANIGATTQEHNAETTPLSHPEYYQYDLDIPAITELWRRGSVIQSWLLDLTAAALHASPSLEEFHGQVSDSGEGRWSAIAAIDEGVPAPVLTTALYSRFSSRGLFEYGAKILSAMRQQFGGHQEKPPQP